MKAFNAAFIFCTLLVLSGLAPAQQPFVTDNAEITDRGRFHLELGNQFDRLQRSALPVRHQNAAHVSVTYGLVKNMEVTVTGTFLALESEAQPPWIGGIGDTGFEVKYRLVGEKEGSARPAVAMTAYVQVPTGDADRSLGSGTTDVGLNGIIQKKIGEKNVVHVNVGYLFAGSMANGVLGITTVHGHVFNGGVSFVRTINERLQLGGEMSGEVSDKFQLGRGQLLFQGGGNYFLNKNMSLDFGLVAGRFVASPRLGAVLGLSIDF